MERRKGHPFLEILAASIHEDFRFPILEVFAFLYAISTFAFLGLGGGITSMFSPRSGEAYTYQLVSIQMGMPLFIFLILIFKNVVYGFGSEFEKGTIQTLLSYPLKRHMVLTAKLLSALGISLLMFLGIQFFALFIMAPQTVSANLTTVVFSYLASLSYPLFLTAILLIVAMKIRKGGLALVLGIVLYFALSVTSGILTALSITTGNPLPLKALSVLNPSLALQYYFNPLGSLIGGETLWNPNFNEVLAYIGGGYCLVIIAFLIAYYYFSRRLNI
ncbi:MAG: ABC transporter permease [archaeon GB-1867-005]|nr:ABC transporter permease [Candidatus Culexmicrobium cathedralense]